MSDYTDSRTGLTLGSTEALELAAVPQAELESAAEAMIRSASGWRKVFGTDDDPTTGLEAADRVLVALAVESFGRYLQEHGCRTVAIATDTRPTAVPIANIALRALLSAGFTLRYGFIAAAPELMAYTRQSDEVDAFLLITASHNPIEHNGLKFGSGDGSVLAAGEAAQIGETFSQLLEDREAQERILTRTREVASEHLSDLFANVEATKEAMLAAYQGSMEQLFTGFAAAETRGELMQRMGQAVQRGRPGIVIDFNGGARATSIDAGFLRGLGAQSFAINKTPGSIAHTIVPEGDALTQCSQTLTALRSKGLGYSLGYVTDNDGDRGNLVFHDSAADAVRPLHAQELFALVCMVELAWMVKTGRLTYDENGRAHQKVAVAVNGPTSLRVERIAHAFDAEVYRAEVGEANVVSLARTLRRRGYLVRILGEGSNGGCIIEPAEVRDPLGTIGALIKLLYTPDLRGVDIRAGADDEELEAGRGPTEEDLEADLFRIWCKRSGRLEQYRSDYGLADVLATLPAFRTTGAYEERAKLQVEEAHGPLKEAYEALFHRRWKELQKQFTDRLDLYLWEEINYEGTDERHGVGRAMRSGSQRGGFKILFKNRSGRPVGYLWMRGSGTEPVFRVVTDVEGSDEQLEQELHRWHVALIQEAAQAAGHAGRDGRSGQG